VLFVKRPLRKTVELVLWAAGSGMAVLLACWWIFEMITARKVSGFAFGSFAFGLLVAFEGFSMFNSVRKSHE
jgi:hypothetical protein